MNRYENIQQAIEMIEEAKALIEDSVRAQMIGIIFRLMLLMAWIRL